MRKDALLLVADRDITVQVTVDGNQIGHCRIARSGINPRVLFRLLVWSAGFNGLTLFRPFLTRGSFMPLGCGSSSKSLGRVHLIP